ncbi:NADH dehydrogenase (ubiquinone) 1 alpha/beta subcomplex 1 protein [Dioscorea alata]|uniref:NADH dehydrogenase (Ubiquinone) 1 alpha/beta subcomplex 1 protein n=1 Tax=Dioscorea alata TaxID=55571 RepID=A0ACB7WNN0_DIOAL|nr:NADH dehydrogenase (ubiquinone) 1 alpha/beta subcomplex 1 protein [Dioscorea alata]
MQHIKASVLRCVRLSCNSRFVVLGDGGRNAGKMARLMCGFASKNGSEEVTSRVIELVKKFDRLDASKVTETADFQKDLSLDSLDRVELVMALEQEFSIEIPDTKADNLKCCRNVVEYILSESQSNKAKDP